ncbi:hypothetical protein SFA35_16720 [Pseudomonas sp. HR96]|uniref:hypothetical protein n=1 Tax=Pseudomonas sp. HR96 TaxID=1027966 RepID=UPI002A753103|nr:hypothetical protein [Pseudomonas sp. HR96]WPO98283.1 hypothetical protein SFA35_16720 [Pseudomonas sp. HR96]
MADLARPFLPLMVFVFVLGTLLRVETNLFWRAARDLKISIAFPLVMVVGYPVAFGMLCMIVTGEWELSMAVALAYASPPASGNAAVCRMLGLDPSMSLVTSLSSMLLVPLTAPLLVTFLAAELDVVIDPLALGLKLAFLLVAAQAIAWLTRKFAFRIVQSYPFVIDGGIVCALFVFALGTMAGLQAAILSDPLWVLALVGVAYFLNALSQVLMCLVYPGDFCQRLTMGLNAGNRNVGLLWSVLGASLSPGMALFFACSQIPIHTMPKILQYLMPILERRLKKT